MENKEPKSGDKRKTRKKTVKTVKTASSKVSKTAKARKNLLFALDIGTRSVIGIVAEQTANGLKLIATARKTNP